jgi:hypothetical protein
VASLAAVKNQHPQDRPATLADRVAEAQQAEAGPRRAVLDLKTRYDTAVAGGDHAEAARTKPLLAEAREALILAEAATAGLRTAQEEIARVQAEDARTAQEAGKRARALELLGAAIQAENRGLDELAEALAQMWAWVGAAQDAFRRAQGLESEVGQARRRAMDARIVSGQLELPPGSPGPRITKPNKASVLLEQNQLIRLMMQHGR